MDLDERIITVFCLLDETLSTIPNGQRLRQRGPHPTLHDSEVLTMEVIGAYLGLEQDQALFTTFSGTGAISFPPWCASIAPPSCVTPPISGRSRNNSGSRSSHSFPMIHRWASRDPDPQQSRRLSRMRYRIETVFSQLVERCHVKRLWARDT